MQPTLSTLLALCLLLPTTLTLPSPGGPPPAPEPPLAPGSNGCKNPGSPPCQRALNGGEPTSSPLEMHLYPAQECKNKKVIVLKDVQLSYFYAGQMSSYWLSRDLTVNENFTIWNRVSNFNEADDIEMVWADDDIDLNCNVFKGEASDSGLKTKGCHNLGEPLYAGCVNILAG